MILEKRVKSSINLDLLMFLNGFKFNIIDNFMKTNTSIATLGKNSKTGDI
ncbi:DNA polymerase [Staphylococcus phage S-CoN_Ph36]|nr:DNA polymerase [Staphylococcus phage S-CoN_Ph36]WNM55797.1 DNA polymerase [Staphylococcus phage S-CoN_Ph37]